MSVQLSRENYKRLKEFIYTLDNGRCHICKGQVSFEQAVLDHIIPHASGLPTEAPDEYWNLRLAHRSCNIRRSNGKIPGQLRLALYREQAEAGLGGFRLALTGLGG